MLEQKEETVNNIEREFVEGAARAMFVPAWIAYERERGRSFPFQNAEGMAPATPDYARLEAARLLGMLEALNGDSPAVDDPNAFINNGVICNILRAAYVADGHPSSVHEPALSVWQRWADENARTFGHYIAMEALGHGVSWFDDHERFPLMVPMIEFELKQETEDGR
jgi:hypothetical protein